MLIKAERFLTALLLVLPSSGFAAPPGANTLKMLDAAIGDMMTAYDKMEECISLEDAFKADLAKKKAALNAEFEGKIPRELDEVLWRKTERAAKQHKLCFQQYGQLTEMFASLAQTFRKLDHTGPIKQKKALVDAQNKKFRLLMPPPKQKNNADAQPDETP